ncbi:MAG: aldo/keto reductase [Acetomicrobium sp.]
MKKLGFGLMRLPLKDPDDQESIDLEELKRMVDHFLEKGFTYFDTAYPYHQGKSEVAIRKALVERYPRDSFTLTDKLPTWIATKYEDYEAIFEEQLERCGVTYFDYYLLHSLDTKRYAETSKLGGFEFIKKLKEQGKIRHIGISYHDSASLLDQILTKHPEIEYVQLQINYLDWDSELIQSGKCYEVATKHKKSVIVMEPVKGGYLANVPPEAVKLFKGYHPDMSVASWAIRYAASLENVFMVLSGMSSFEQMVDNVSVMENFIPLNDEEMGIIKEAVEIIKKKVVIPCTACRYCVDGCPKHIAIPEYFAVYNERKTFGPTPVQVSYYNNLTGEHGKASDCIACGQCEEHCPQHIKIIDALRDVAKEFEAEKETAQGAKK